MQDVLDKTFATFGALVHSKETGVGAKDLTGPVGILSHARRAGEQRTIAWRLSFLVLLNINLAFINLLPIPVLDGGHILMAIIEKIRRRPLSLEICRIHHDRLCRAADFASCFTSRFSTSNGLRCFRAMFKTDVQIEQTSQPAASTPAPAK